MNVCLTDFQSPGGGGDNGSCVIINEPGLYKLILRSRRPKVIAFQNWVTYEVLPSIRKKRTISLGNAHRIKLMGKINSSHVPHAWVYIIKRSLNFEPFFVS